MATEYNPRIVTDNLVLCLDAANTKSYSGSGTTWYDLSGNGNNATIEGSSVWTSDDGGKFDFGDEAQTTKYIILPHAAAQSTGTDYTFEFWMQPLAQSHSKYWNSMAIQSNDNYTLYQQHNSERLYRFQNGGTYVSYSNNEKLQFCVVRNGSDTGKFYKNGVYVTDSTNITVINGVDNGGWILNQEQDSVGGGFSNAQNYRGAFMIVRLYNKALSAAEVKQNFDAIKGRYGL